MAAYCMALVSSTIIFEGFILLMSVTTSGYHNRLLLFIEGHVWELASILAKRRITRCIESQDSHYTILFSASILIRALE